MDTKQYQNINVRKCDYISTPAVAGFFHPIILIPPIAFDNDELKLILQHELQHLKFYDTIFKLFLEIMASIYWWNPFMHILKKHIENLLELRVDTKISEKWDGRTRIKYLECLTKVHAYQLSANHHIPALSFIGQRTNFLTKRAKYLTIGSPKSSFKVIVVLCTSFMLLLSLVIFEPSIHHSAKTQDTFEAEDIYNNGYFIKTGDTYRLYLGGKDLGTVDNPQTGEFAELPVYSENER